jgi:hypothetical protein
MSHCWFFQSLKASRTRDSLAQELRPFCLYGRQRTLWRNVTL